jgi:hypothetical protein
MHSVELKWPSTVGTGLLAYSFRPGRQAGIRQASFVCTIGFVGTLKPGEGIIIVIIIIIIHKKKK